MTTEVKTDCDKVRQQPAEMTKTGLIVAAFLTFCIVVTSLCDVTAASGMLRVNVRHSVEMQLEIISRKANL